MVISPNPSLLDGFTKEENEILYSKLKNIRIMDPACGTGLFFFEIATILFQMYELFPIEFDRVSLTDIFEHNLFGIDINPHILFKLHFLIQLFLYEAEGSSLENPEFSFC